VVGLADPAADDDADPAAEQAGSAAATHRDAAAMAATCARHRRGRPIPWACHGSPNADHARV